MRSQPEQPLRAMFEPMAVQWQGFVWMSWLILSLENTGMSLVTTVTRDHVDVQGLCNNWPPIIGCGALESWPHLSATAAENGPCASLRQHSGTGPGDKDVSELAQRS